MHIASINSFAPNFLGLPKNRAPLYDKDNSYLNCCPSVVVDSVAFSKPLSSRKPETVTSILKSAKINGKPRFSPFQISKLNSELQKFNSYMPTTKILKELLKMEYKNNKGQKEKLNLVDIASFFNVMDNATIHQINGVLSLMNYSFNNNLINSSNSLDDYVFLPVENNPKMLVEIGKLENRYKHLPQEKRGEIISIYKDVAEASDYKFQNLAEDIATATLNDTQQCMYPLLIKGAESCSRKEFKSLLKSLTPEQYALIYEEFANCNDADSEENFFKTYINNFTNI